MSMSCYYSTVLLSTIGLAIAIYCTISYSPQFGSFLRESAAAPHSIRICNQMAAAANILCGEWVADNLPAGGDPGSPDEALIIITEDRITFPYGGGGFANGPYTLDADNSYTAHSGGESIKFSREGDALQVHFGGGEYNQHSAKGTGTLVIYHYACTQ